MKYQQVRLALQPLQEHKHGSKETSSLAFNLIRKRSWSDLLRFLQKYRTEKEFTNITYGNNKFAFFSESEISVCKEFPHARNVLHYACQYQAPGQVVFILQKINYRYAYQSDNDGRTPLHIAAAYGAPDDAISILLKEFPLAARIKDKFGKTPLISACAQAGNSVLHKEFKRDGNETGICIPSPRVIRELCNACGESVIAEDDDETSALEYAIINVFDSKSIMFLQKANMKIRRMSSRNKGKRDNDPENDERWNEFGETHYR